MRPWLPLTTMVFLAFAGCVDDAQDAPVPGGADPDSPLVASIAYAPDVPRAGESVAFEAVASGGVPPYAYAWDFGDATSKIARPLHVFDAAGDHAVRLDVTDAEGQVASDQVSIFVVAAGTAGGGTPGAGGSGDGGAGGGGSGAPILNGTVATIQDETVQALYDEIEAAILQDGTVSVQATEIAGILGSDSWGSVRSFDLRLQPSPILDEATFFEVDGRPFPAPFVKVYEGHEDGEEDNLARLVLSSWWARGTVRDGDTSYAIRINFDGNAPRGSGERPVASNTSSEPFSPSPSGCQSGLAAWAPIYAEPVVAVGRSTHPAITADIILDGDGPLVDTLGMDAFATLVAQLAEVDSIYDYEVSIRFRVAGVHLHTGDVYPDPDGGSSDTPPFDHMQAYWGGRDVGPWDVIHLVTGHESGYAMANCIGGAGTAGGFTFTPYPWELRYEVFHINAYAHELGHIFDAHHHYGNHGEADLATIMIQGYTPGYDPNFSSLSKAAIRGWAEQYLS